MNEEEKKKRINQILKKYVGRRNTKALREEITKEVFKIAEETSITGEAAKEIIDKHHAMMNNLRKKS